MIVRHPPGRMARPDQIDEGHCFTEPRLAKRIEFPLMFKAEVRIHGVHAGEFCFERAMVFVQGGALTAQLDEVAVDEAVEDGHHRFSDRHDEWAANKDGRGEERK